MKVYVGVFLATFDVEFSSVGKNENFYLNFRFPDVYLHDVENCLTMADVSVNHAGKI